MCIVILRLQTKVSCCESLCVFLSFSLFSFLLFLILFYWFCVREVEKVWFTLSICCQVAKVHIALLFSVYVHSLKKKKKN